MTTARSLRLASLLPLVLLLTPLPAAAQFSSAIQGTVTDSQQAFVPEATVRVTNTTTGVTREAMTSADGVYRVPSLGAGVYSVEVEKAGFLKAQREACGSGSARRCGWTSRWRSRAWPRA